MPRNKDLKRLVRARMEKTGEAYTTARAHIVRSKQRKQAPTPDAAAAPSQPDTAEPSAARKTPQPDTARPSTARKTQRAERAGRRAAPPQPDTAELPAASTKPRPKAAGPLPLPDDYEKVAGMSDAAVKKASGRSWPEWAALLDAAGAAGMEHRAIAKHLRDSHGLSGWWAQMITVGYERLRGLRAVGQRRGGAYEAHKSVTVAAPVDVLWRAVHDARQRARWLKGVKLEIRTATAPRSMRIRLADGIKMDAYFTAKGPAKSALALQLSGFPDKEAAQAAKQFWGERLEALKRLVAAE